MRRFPILPTLAVALAVALMIGLGIWQIGRAKQKEALLARYAVAAKLPPVAWPAVPPADGSLLFRRSEGYCVSVAGWSTRAGQSIDGRSGWRHIASCRTGGAEGPGMQVDMGWSEAIAPPSGWTGGPVRGVIDADRDHLILLVSDSAAPGLLRSAPPSPESIPNNHRAYAVQWFLFAAVALVIYAFALRRRWLGGGGSGIPS